MEDIKQARKIIKEQKDRWKDAPEEKNYKDLLMQTYHRTETIKENRKFALVDITNMSTTQKRKLYCYLDRISEWTLETPKENFFGKKFIRVI